MGYLFLLFFDVEKVNMFGVIVIGFMLVLMVMIFDILNFRLEGVFGVFRLVKLKIKWVIFLLLFIFCWLVFIKVIIVVFVVLLFFIKVVILVLLGLKKVLE